MIKIKNVFKEFKNGYGCQKVLKDVSYNISEGDFVTIMGASGGGKTTFLNCIALLTEPTNGEIYFDGEKVDYKNEKNTEKLRRDNIGLVFQNSNLISCLSPLENLIVAMDSKISFSEKKKKALELLDKVGLKDKQNSSVEGLSGGEAQRVAIVRALVNNPKVLLCDEPTGALDSNNSQVVLELLQTVRKELKCALVIVTHNEKIGSLGKKKILLEEGKIYEL